VFTRVLHWSLSRPGWIQSTPPYSTSLRSILISSSHLCLGLPSGLPPSGFPTKTLHALLCSHACYMPCPFHPPWFDPFNYTWRRVQLRSSSLYRFLQLNIISSLFGPNILSILCSNPSSLSSSLKARLKFHTHTNLEAKFSYCDTYKIVTFANTNFFLISPSAASTDSVQRRLRSYRMWRCVIC
jgi:hypothetical protein